MLSLIIPITGLMLVAIMAQTVFAVLVIYGTGNKYNTNVI